MFFLRPVFAGLLCLNLWFEQTLQHVLKSVNWPGGSTILDDLMVECVRSLLCHGLLIPRHA